MKHCIDNDSPSSIQMKKENTVASILPLLLLFILLAAMFINFSHYAISMLLYPFEWDSFEGYHVYQSWRVALGEPLYKNINTYPLLVSNYPPVYFILGGGLLKVFGLAFWPLRLLSLLAALTIGLMIFLIIKTENSSTYWALIGALLFFASPLYVSYYLLMVRIDGLALAFSLIGLFFIRRGLESNKALAIAGFCFLLAVYTKQTAVLAAIAGWLWLLVNNSKRALILGLLGMVCGGAIVFVLIDSNSGGEFSRQLFFLNVGWATLDQGGRLFIGFLNNWGVFFSVAIAAIFSARHKQCIWNYFFILSLFNGIFAIRHGAVSAYYLPIIAAIAIICGIYAPRLDRLLTIATGEDSRRGRWGLCLAAIIGLTAANSWQYIRPTRDDAHIVKDYWSRISCHYGDILTFQMHSLAFLNLVERFLCSQHLWKVLPILRD